MSPRKVNKEEKRREIAISCADLIHDVGMKNITVSEVARTAGIGKGTVYEYFENKEDIIFEIINFHIETYHSEFERAIEGIESTKEKITHFFRFVLDDNEENQRMFNGYKQFLSIVLSDENSAMKEFNCDTNEFFIEKLKEVVQEGIDKGELIPESIDLVRGLLTYEKGLALQKMAQLDYDVKADFELCINTVFKLIEVKKQGYMYD